MLPFSAVFDYAISIRQFAIIDFRLLISPLFDVISPCFSIFSDYCC